MSPRRRCGRFQRAETVRPCVAAPTPTSLLLAEEEEQEEQEQEEGEETEEEEDDDEKSLCTSERICLPVIKYT